LKQFLIFLISVKAFLSQEYFHTVNFLLSLQILSVAYFNSLFLIIYRNWFFKSSSRIPVFGSSFETVSV